MHDSSPFVKPCAFLDSCGISRFSVDHSRTRCRIKNVANSYSRTAAHNRLVMSAFRRIVSGPPKSFSADSEDIERGPRVPHNSLEDGDTSAIPLRDLYILQETSAPKKVSTEENKQARLMRDISKASRISNADSEFSRVQEPVTPDRYMQAWDKLNNSSSQVPLNENSENDGSLDFSELDSALKQNTDENGINDSRTMSLAHLNPGTSQTDSSSSPSKQGVASASTRLPFSFEKQFQEERTYHHPVPLSSSHRNPFQTAPPLLENVSDEQSHINGSEANSYGNEMNRQSKNSAFTDTFDKLVETHGSSFETGREENRSSGREWTTTSSGADNPSEQPQNQGSRQVSVPGAKQVGSSLAGVSSPPSTAQGVNTSSYKTPTTHRHRHRRSSSDSKYELIASPEKTRTSALPSPLMPGHRKRNTMTGLMSAEDSSFYSDEETSESPFKSQLRERNVHRSNPDHDEISSSTGSAELEANTYREQISPFASSTGLEALPQLGSTSQASLPAPQGSGAHSPKSPTASTGSRAFVQDGVIYTDVPRPVFVHPVYGLNRPWDSTPPRGRPQARADRYQRPIARRESPHLHHIPRPPTAVMLERQKGISGFWLIIFCIIPPIALIFGHGFADEIIRMQTDGEIDAFTDSSKNTALICGYVGTPVVIIIIFVAVFFGTS